MDHARKSSVILFYAFLLVIIPISAFTDKSSEDSMFKIYFESGKGIQQTVTYLYGLDSSVLEIEGHLFGWKDKLRESYNLLLIFVFPDMVAPDSLELNAGSIQVWIDNEELILFKTSGFHQDTVHGGYNVVSSFMSHTYLGDNKKLIRKYPEMQKPFIKIAMNNALMTSGNAVANDTLYAYPRKPKKTK
jgi:hypothetical protein